MKKFNFADGIKDLNAGLVVFLVALPLCLGIALASKAPLMSGIIAGIIGGVVVGALSGSQLGVSGPAAGLVGIVVAGIVACGSFEAFCLATLLAGGMQLVLGLVRAGGLAQYFPTSVIKGMLAGIGIIIILKQIPHLVGIDSDYEGDLDFFQNDGETTISEFRNLFEALTPGAVLIGLAGLAIMLVWNLPKIKQHKVLGLIPGPLLAVGLGVALQVLFEQTGSSLALSPEHLVQITASSNPVEWVQFPKFSEIGNGQVWVYALLICVIASIESLLCAEATDKIDPQLRVSNKNRELLAQGAGNIFSGLLGGIPVTQVVVRSSANIQAGGRTRASTIFHGILIFVMVATVPWALNEIPMASLASVLLLVGYNLAKPSLIKKYYKKGWTQFIPFVVTVPLVVANLLLGVGIGIAVAIFFILRRNFRAPYTYHLEEQGGKRILTLKLANIVSFMNKGVIIQTLELIPRGSNVVIDASDCGLIDPDVVEAIEDFMTKSPQNDIQVKIIGSLDHSEVVKNPTKELHAQLESLARKHMASANTESTYDK